MGEKGLIQETNEKKSEAPRVPATASAPDFPDTSHLTEVDPNQAFTKYVEGKKSSAGDTAPPSTPGGTSPLPEPAPKTPAPLTPQEEEAAARAMAGLDPWNGVVDPPEETAEQQSEGPDVQDVKGDLTPDKDADGNDLPPDPTGLRTNPL